MQYSAIGIRPKIQQNIKKSHICGKSSLESGREYNKISRNLIFVVKAAWNPAENTTKYQEISKLWYKQPEIRVEIPQNNKKSRNCGKSSLESEWKYPQITKNLEIVVKAGRNPAENTTKYQEIPKIVVKAA